MSNEILLNKKISLEKYLIKITLSNNNKNKNKILNLVKVKYPNLIIEFYN
tara:strand:- start:170 stop:319 length:150 start_codon:yes stop_codon:yes gene_type:complete